jgi:hypothetical protein
VVVDPKSSPETPPPLAVPEKYIQHSNEKSPVPMANAALLATLNELLPLKYPLHPVGLNGLKVPCVVLPDRVTRNSLGLESMKLMFLDGARVWRVRRDVADSAKDVLTLVVLG